MNLLIMSACGNGELKTKIVGESTNMADISIMIDKEIALLDDNVKFVNDYSEKGVITMHYKGDVYDVMFLVKGDGCNATKKVVSINKAIEIYKKAQTEKAENIIKEYNISSATFYRIKGAQGKYNFLKTINKERKNG